MREHFFAYASFMDPETAAQACGPMLAVGPAALRNWRMVFDSPSRQHPGYGRGGLSAAPGHVMWGVVYALSPEQAAKLDAAEPDHERMRVTVRLKSGAVRECFACRAKTSVPGLKPHPDYVALIVRGARKHGLPHDAIADLLPLMGSARPGG
ncbi:MAG: hypothetical protein GMKNLPBB_02854 [Myxococcota bacterium]|nr:hypothetical protein [Myxococcota bacterium]